MAATRAAAAALNRVEAFIQILLIELVVRSKLTSEARTYTTVRRL